MHGNGQKTVGKRPEMLGKQPEMLGNGWKMLGNKQTNETKVAQNVSKMIKPLNRHRKQCLEGFRKPDRHSG